MNTLVNAVGPVDVGVSATIEELDDEEWASTFEIGTDERGALRPRLPARCCAPRRGVAS